MNGGGCVVGGASVVGGGASEVGGGGGGASDVGGGGGGASVMVTGGGGACRVTVRVWGACVCGCGAGASAEIGADDVGGSNVVTGPVVEAGDGVVSSRITYNTAATSATSKAATPAPRMIAGFRYHGSGAASSSCSYCRWSKCIGGRASVTPPLASPVYSYGSVGATSGTSSASDHASAPNVLDAGASCGSIPGAIAVAAAAAAATPGAADSDVLPSSTVPRAARRPPPIAAVNSGCPVVMTGTRKCSDNVVVMIGMRAPPPTEATATRSAVRIPLRSKVSWTTPTKSASGLRIASSSSLRVSRISPLCPGSSATREVTALVDSRSLAPRHWARSRLSEPIADVPDRSMVPAADRSLMTWVNNAWSMRSPDRSV